MGAPKGKPHRKWSKEEKLRIIHIHLDEHMSIEQIERKHNVSHTVSNAHFLFLRKNTLVHIIVQPYS